MQESQITLKRKEREEVNKRTEILEESLKILHKQQIANRIWIACASAQLILAIIALWYVVYSCQ